jgi:hypothetical protein
VPQGEQWWVYKSFRDSNKTVDGLGVRKFHYILQENGTHANNRKRTQRLVQGEPAWGVGDGGLTSQPAQLQSFGLFLVGRLWVIGQYKASQKNWGPDPKDEGGDGVPWQGHHGEGLLEVEVLDWGCCHRWQPFHCINWYSICPSANSFFLQ